MCLRCKKPYEQKRRQASHFCPGCRSEIHAEKQRASKREARARERELRAEADEMVKRGMNPDYVNGRWRQVVDDITAEQDKRETLVPDRMPDGANSPAGPDDGRSTDFGDIGVEIDIRAREAANHQWFKDNPHWNYDMHEADALRRF